MKIRCRRPMLRLKNTERKDLKAWLMKNDLVEERQEWGDSGKGNGRERSET